MIFYFLKSKTVCPRIIAAAIKAIFIILGSPDLKVRDMVLSYKKFYGMLVIHQCNQLGMVIGTRKWQCMSHQHTLTRSANYCDHTGIDIISISQLIMLLSSVEKVDTWQKLSQLSTIWWHICTHTFQLYWIRTRSIWHFLQNLSEKH